MEDKTGNEESEIHKAPGPKPGDLERQMLKENSE
jgi:hypothetical protein